ncbi:unnamed protein product [Adineta steineri]|uniref:Translation elongation factor EF1B beta/delta subunit guanine nucleotide exchange domain-containing protein n=1 Tax=Adineta steineri TaxID=433720 RepID=A0A815PJT5_9BILA|nr:unnamed protein product [Adineta steineri]
MNFGDLQSDDGLVLLNNFLADKSYIEGYCPSQGDVVVFEAIKKVPSAGLENALRWYNHISSFDDAERQKFQGQRQSLEYYKGQDNQEKHESKLSSVSPADNFDLFSNNDNEEESEIRKQRVKAHIEKNAKKSAPIAKSGIVLDVKPWDDETNMEELEKNVRSIELDGLIWGTSCFVPIAYGIRILKIACVIENKVSTDLLEERITEFEDLIQSVDIALFRNTPQNEEKSFLQHLSVLESADKNLPPPAMSTFRSNPNTPVWPAEDKEHYFRDLVIQPLLQKGPACVSTCLAMLTGKKPKDFQGNINTQDPVSWSAALKPYGMKLAYCPHDARKMKFYIEELITLDDLFGLSFYTAADPKNILVDPDETGFVTQSHFILLHRDKIYDPNGPGCVLARDHRCVNYHTKRIFRVLPVTHARGL